MIKLFKFIFHWRIIALQCCVGLCIPVNRPQEYVYPLSLNLPAHPSRLSQSTGPSSLCYTAPSLWLSVLHTVLYVSVLLCKSVPPFPSRSVSTSLFSVSASVSLPCHFFSTKFFISSWEYAAAAAAKSLQSCPTLQPHGRSLPGSSVYGIFQARVLEWGAIVFS